MSFASECSHLGIVLAEGEHERVYRADGPCSSFRPHPFAPAYCVCGHIDLSHDGAPSWQTEIDRRRRGLKGEFGSSPASSLIRWSDARVRAINIELVASVVRETHLRNQLEAAEERIAKLERELRAAGGER